MRRRDINQTGDNSPENRKDAVWDTAGRRGCVVYGGASNKQKGLDQPLKGIYHTLYGMNNFVTNKSKLTQDGAQLFPYMG